MRTITLIATLMLTACANQPQKPIVHTEQVEVTKYVKQPVDAALTTPIVVPKPEPKCNDGTGPVRCNGQQSDYRAALEQAVEQCNRDRKTVRDGQGD